LIGKACGDRVALAIPGHRVHIVGPFRQGETSIRQAEIGASVIVI
jgi:hypothetical protein